MAFRLLIERHGEAAVLRHMISIRSVLDATAAEEKKRKKIVTTDE